MENLPSFPPGDMKNKQIICRRREQIKKNVVVIRLNVYDFLVFCFIHKTGVVFAIVAAFIYSVVAEFSL